MKPEKIKSSLKKLGIKNTAIARELEVSNTSVYDVIIKKRVSFKIQSYIASVLGKTLHEVFPEYYGPDCLPRKSGMPMAKID